MGIIKSTIDIFIGYKSILGSLDPTSNATDRENCKANRAQERTRKKIKKINEKMEDIENALKDLFVKGKIDKKKFHRLLKRKDDIGIDLVIFGKTPGINLAKRYICGVIDKKEFENIEKEIIPGDLADEKKTILNGYNERCDLITTFEKNCKKRASGTCQKCGKKDRFLSKIKDVEGLMLCGKCAKELKDFQDYPGYNGSYLSADAVTITIEDVKKKRRLTASVNPESL